MDKKTSNIILGLLWMNALQAGHNPNVGANVGKKPNNGGLEPVVRGAPRMGVPVQNNPKGSLGNQSNAIPGSKPMSAQDQELMAKLRTVTDNFKKKYYGDASIPANVTRAVGEVDNIMKNYPQNSNPKIGDFAVQTKMAIEMQGTLARQKNNAKGKPTAETERAACVEIDTVAEQYKKSTQSPSLILWIQACADKYKAYVSIQTVFQTFLQGQYGDCSVAANLVRACSAIDDIVNAIGPGQDAQSLRNLREFAYRYKSIMRLEAILKRFLNGGYGAPKDTQSFQNAEKDVSAITNQLDRVVSPGLKNAVTQGATQLQAAMRLYGRLNAIDDKFSKNGYGDPKIPEAKQNVEKDIATVEEQVNKINTKRWGNPVRKKIAELSAKIK
jgi:hypothetical protein